MRIRRMVCIMRYVCIMCLLCLIRIDHLLYRMHILRDVPSARDKAVTKEIEEILHQKSWTGDQVGKALIASAIHAYQHALSSNSVSAELFSAAQLKRMVDSLSDREQLLRYNRYVGLNNWLTQYQAVANAYMQRADGRIGLLCRMLEVSVSMEQANCNLVESLRKIDGASIPLNIIQSPATNYGVGQYTQRCHRYQERIEELYAYRKDFIFSYRYLLGYNTAITMIAKYISMPDFIAFQPHTASLLRRANDYNRLVSELKDCLIATEAYDPAYQKEKLNALCTHFPPLFLLDLSVPSSALQEAAAMLQDNMRAFERQDGRFMQLLTDWGHTQDA